MSAPNARGKARLHLAATYSPGASLCVVPVAPMSIQGQLSPVCSSLILSQKTHLTGPALHSQVFLFGGSISAQALYLAYCEMQLGVASSALLRSSLVGRPIERFWEGFMDQFGPVLEPSIWFCFFFILVCFLTSLVSFFQVLFFPLHFFKYMSTFSIQVVHFTYTHVIFYRYTLNIFQIYDEYLFSNIYLNICLNICQIFQIHIEHCFCILLNIYLHYANF